MTETKVTACTAANISVQAPVGWRCSSYRCVGETADDSDDADNAARRERYELEAKGGRGSSASNDASRLNASSSKTMSGPATAAV